MVFKNEKEYGNYPTIKRVVARMTKARFPLGEFVRATQNENKDSAT